MLRPRTPLCNILIGVTVLLAGCGDGNKEPEGLGEKVFQALHDEDAEAYEKYVVTAADFEQVVGDSTMDEDKKAQALKHVESQLEKGAGNFEKVLERGKAAGVDWSETTFVEVKYEIETQGGMTGADEIMIIFEHDGTKYRVEIDDPLKADRGWVITDGLAWRGPVK